MSLVEELRAAHRERLQRINSNIYRKPPPPQTYNPPEYYYHCMWFFDLVAPHTPVGITNRVEDILRSVARYYGVSKLDLISARRTKQIVRPRMVAAYLAKTLTGKSLPEIGRRIGGRDHTTILHSVRKIQQQLDGGDVELTAEVAAISAGFRKPL